MLRRSSFSCRVPLCRVLGLKYIVEVPGILADAMSSLSIGSVCYKICYAIVWLFSIPLGITDCVWVGLRHILLELVLSDQMYNFPSFLIS